MKLRTAVSILVRGLGAALRGNASGLREQRSRLAFQLMQGEGLETERLHLGLSLIRHKLDSITFHDREVHWSAPAKCTAITPFLLAYGGFGWHQIQAFVSWLNDTQRPAAAFPFIIDVGANIGTTSIPLAKDFGFRIVAIEPIPENFELLSKNVRQNRLDEAIQCVRSAVSTEGEKLSMVTAPDNSGGAEVKVDGRDQGFGPVSSSAEVVSVPVTTLDQVVRDYVGDCRKIAAVWSDTQGHEAQVIGSGATLWKAGVPLYCEIWPRGLEAHGGVRQFITLACRHFTSFVTCDDVLLQGVGARHRPLSELAGFFEELGTEGTADAVFLSEERKVG